MDVEGVFLGGEAKRIGLTVGDSASGHEHGAGFGVVVAAAALGRWSAPEFASPNGEGVIEEAALFEEGIDGGGFFFGAVGRVSFW